MAHSPAIDTYPATTSRRIQIYRLSRSPKNLKPSKLIYARRPEHIEAVDQLLDEMLLTALRYNARPRKRGKYVIVSASW